MLVMSRLRLALLLTAPLLMMTPLPAESAEAPVQRSEHIYKQTPQGELTIHAWQPAAPAEQLRPAAVLFHGGGWGGGTPGQFFGQAQHLAEHGMVAFSVQYRVRKVHGTTPVECVQDAISAVRWVRAHAGDFGINPHRIAAGGGSAGGHLAAVTATLPADAAPQYDKDEDRSVSFRPQALVLFNPVYDNGPDGYGHGRLGEHWQALSPLHNIGPDMPPTLVMLGDQDNLVPVVTAQTFRDRMLAVGVRSDLIVYPDQGHGFFNHEETGMRQATIAAMTDFFRSLDWID
jgi:acetyl esterase/lipase